MLKRRKGGERCWRWPSSSSLSALRGVACAQLAPPDLVSARSYSGQFIAYAGRSAPLPPAVLSLATNQDFVQLEPTLATVSCERIKQLLLRELDATAPWRGTIYLVLYPARAASDTITITSERFKNGWQYRVDFPDVVERSRYVRAMVQVLLLEHGESHGAGARGRDSALAGRRLLATAAGFQ